MGQCAAPERKWWTPDSVVVETVIEDPIQVAVDKGAYLWGLKSNFFSF